MKSKLITDGKIDKAYLNDWDESLKSLDEQKQLQEYTFDWDNDKRIVKIVIDNINSTFNCDDVISENELGD